MGVEVYRSAQISATEVHAPTLLALRGGGAVGVKFPEKRILSEETILN